MSVVPLVFPVVFLCFHVSVTLHEYSPVYNIILFCRPGGFLNIDQIPNIFSSNFSYVMAQRMKHWSHILGVWGTNPFGKTEKCYFKKNSSVKHLVLCFLVVTSAFSRFFLDRNFSRNLRQTDLEKSFPILEIKREIKPWAFNSFFCRDSLK